MHCVSGSAGNSAEEALAGMVSPPSGYSSGDEPVPYATAEQAASIKARPLSPDPRPHFLMAVQRPLCLC